MSCVKERTLSLIRARLPGDSNVLGSRSLYLSMVKRLLNFFQRETKGLHAAAYLLAFFAVLSQILAFLRDRLLAHIFGASQSLDIYYAAFKIPDFIFVTVASVVSLSVLVPFIVEKEKMGKDQVKRFIDDIFSFFVVLISLVCLLAFFFIPSLSSLLFKGFSEEALKSVVLLSRILLISPIMLGFSNLLGSITQTYNRFALYALAPKICANSLSRRKARICESTAKKARR